MPGLKIFGNLATLFFHLFWSSVEVLSIAVSLFLWNLNTFEKSRTISWVTIVFPLLSGWGAGQRAGSRGARVYIWVSRQQEESVTLGLARASGTSEPTPQ